MSDVVPKNMFSQETIGRSIPYLLVGLIFFNPIPHTTTVKEACYYFAVLGGLFLLIKKEREFILTPPLSTPLYVLSLWATLSLVWSLDRVSTVHDLQTLLLENVIYFLLVINFFQDRKKVLNLLNAVVYSTVGFAVYSICSFYLEAGHGFDKKFVTGLTEIPVNWVGFFAVFAFLISLQYLFDGASRARKIFSCCSLIVILFLIFLCQSRSAVLAVSFSAIMYLLLKQKKILVVTFLLIVAGGLYFSPVSKKFDYKIIARDPRLSIFYTSVEVVEDYPLTGIGFGADIYARKIDVAGYFNRVPEQIRVGQSAFPDPHSMLFEVAVMLGIPGVVMFVWVLVSFVMLIVKLIRHSSDDFVHNWSCFILCAMIGYLPVAFLEPAFHQLSLLIFFTILSVGVVLWRLDNEHSASLPGHSDDDLSPQLSSHRT